MSVEPKERISELASLMEEYRLGEATYSGEEFSVTFKRRTAKKPTLSPQEDSSEFESGQVEVAPAAPVVQPVAGTPVASPMTGIYYASPSPNSSPFVREGDTVTAGQIIGLIEAMKVFNEIPCTVSGVVKKIVAEAGQIVSPGDVLILVG